VKGVLAEPADAAEVREQVAIVEKLQPVVPDRGAVLYFLSTAKQHLGETRASLCGRVLIRPVIRRSSV